MTSHSMAFDLVLRYLWVDPEAAAAAAAAAKKAKAQGRDGGGGSGKTRMRGGWACMGEWVHEWQSCMYIHIYIFLISHVCTHTHTWCAVRGRRGGAHQPERAPDAALRRARGHLRYARGPSILSFMGGFFLENTTKEGSGATKPHRLLVVSLPRYAHGTHTQRWRRQPEPEFQPP